MNSQAITKYVGISRRKVARLANEVRMTKVAIAKARLAVLPQKAAHQLLKTIRSAEGNFLFKNQNANTDNLIIRTILVDKGPSLKRIMPRARGSADSINKPSCHIKVIVSD